MPLPFPVAPCEPPHVHEASGLFTQYPMLQSSHGDPRPESTLGLATGFASIPSGAQMTYHEAPPNDRYITWPTLKKWTQASEATLRRWMHSGRIPGPIKIGPRAVRFDWPATARALGIEP